MEIGNLLFGNSRGTYPVDRDTYQDAFCNFLERNGFDGYGHKEGSDDDVFENDTFVIRPYYWGDDEDVAMLPNFVYKPENIELSWYKYPMRDAYCSIELTPEKLQEILTACEQSLK